MDKEVVLMSSYEAVVFVTRQYHWLVKPLEAMVEKYMGIPLTFLSDRPIETKHRVIEAFPFDCKLYGEPVGAKVKAALAQIQAHNILFFFADFLPQKPVDMKGLDALSRFMEINGSVARANLWSDVQEQIKNQVTENISALLGIYEELMIIKLDQYNQHIGQIGSTSLMPALWSKAFLMEFIEDNWTLDNIELPGQKKFAEQSKWFSIGTHPGLLQIAHLCFTSDLNMVRLTQMKDEDKEIVIPHIPQHFRIE